ncbi:MAG: LEPR-XLL domain-containing protein [Phycisphaera sp.]|nr:LEPR-XLL domain-containing protein [Phycisphaera sp.]
MQAASGIGPEDPQAAPAARAEHRARQRGGRVGRPYGVRSFREGPAKAYADRRHRPFGRSSELPTAGPDHQAIALATRSALRHSQNMVDHVGALTARPGPHKVNAAHPVRARGAERWDSLHRPTSQGASMSKRQSRRARVLWLCRWFLNRLRRGAARVATSAARRETRPTEWRDLETLEPRVLMSASVAGKVFDDTNQNGLYETGEQGLSDWRVYVDADQDGVLDIGETYVMSSASGNYVLPNLVAGSHQIRVEYPAGWEATDPWLEVNNVTVADGDSLTGVDFSAQFVDFGIITQAGTANLISGPSTIDEGDIYTLALNTGGNPSVGWTIDWGDGTVDDIEGTPLYATHEYDDGDFTYNITATLQNDHEGVSRAYWRNNYNDWVGASPTDSFNTIFGVSATGNPTLDDAINANGGHENHLLREATAALLNALHPELFASLNFDDLKSLVQQAYATGDFTSFAVQINQASTNSGIIQGGELTDTLSVFVENEAPTLILSGASSVNQGETYTLGLFSNDTSADTITHWTINWGDSNIVTVPGDPSSTTHVYAAPGNYIISAMATDEDGTFSANVLGVTVASVGSPVTISGSTSTNEGGVYTLGIATSGTIQSLSVNWGDGNVESLATGATSASHIYIDGPNTFPVVAEVTTASGTFSSNTISVNVANVAPTVTISGPPEVDEGTGYVLTIAASDPAGTADTITQTVINWGDGAIETVAGLPSSRNHTYVDGPASYSVVATVTDEDGSANSNNLAVTVNNVDPTVTISGDPAATIGEPYTLNLFAADPGTDTITQTVISWGDGNVETVPGIPGSATHTYTAAAPVQISVSVTDEDGVTSSNTLSVTVGVGNEAPTDIEFFTSGTDEGGTANLTIRFVDRDLADTHAVTVNWYDASAALIGSATQVGSGNVDAAGVRTFNFGQLYAQDTAAYAEVEVVEQNASAGTLPGTAGFAVANVGPSDLDVSVNVLTTLAEGSSISLEGSFFDPGSDDPHDVWIDWGDGDAPTSPTLTLAGGILVIPATDHLYKDNGTYTITVKVEDEDNAFVETSFDVTVFNVGPSGIQLAAGSDMDGGFVLSGSFLDPGVLDTHEVLIDWGDGTDTLNLGAGETTFEMSHAFSTGGVHAVSVTVTDKDMASTTAGGSFYVGDVEYRVSDVGPFTVVTTDPSITSLSGTFNISPFAAWNTDRAQAILFGVEGYVDESGESPYWGSYFTTSYFDPYFLGSEFQVTTFGAVGGEFLPPPSPYTADQDIIAYDAGYGGGTSDFDYDDAYVVVDVESRRQIAAADVAIVEGFSPGQSLDQITIDQTVTVSLNASVPSTGQWQLSADGNIELTDNGGTAIALDTWQSTPAPGSVKVKGVGGGGASITLRVMADLDDYGGSVTLADTANLTVYDYGLTVQQLSASATEDWVTPNITDPFFVWDDGTGIATFDVLGKFLAQDANLPFVNAEPNGNMVLWQITDTDGVAVPNGVLVSAAGEVTIDTNVITLPTDYVVSAHWDLNHDGIPNDGMKRSITVRPAKIDLDVDSDNTVEDGTPDRTDAEDAIELSGDGKYIALRAKSPGDDGYEDYKYVPIVLELSPSGAPEDGYFVFDGGNVELYMSEDEVTFTQLIKGDPYMPSNLGLTAGSALTLYMEGVYEGTGTVTAEYYTSNGVTAVDEVTVTVLGPHVTCGCGASVGPDGDYETSTAGVSGGQVSSDTYLSDDSANNEMVNLPEVVLAGNAIVFRQNRETRIYDILKNGSIVPRVDGQGQLEKVGSNYVESDPYGYKSTYSGAPETLGRLLSVADPSGRLTTYTYDPNGQLISQSWSDTSGGETTFNTLRYEFEDGVLTGSSLASTVGPKAGSAMRGTSYEYYAAGEIGGPEGTPKRIVISDGSGQEIESNLYRYYTEGDSIGKLKFNVSGESYDRIVAAGLDPETATDEDIAPYADEYLEYDTEGRVIKRVIQGAGCSTCSGGLSTTLYSYEHSTFADDYNAWSDRVTETILDADNIAIYSHTTYYNYAGQTMLDVEEDPTTGDQWLYFTAYDSDGRSVLSAGPSAVTGFDDLSADLLAADISGNYQYLNDTAGVIYLTDYYTSTTATDTVAGGAEGYVQDQSIVIGELGTPILTASRDYYHITDGAGGEIFPTASSTRYVNENGTGALTTTYSYTFFTGTLQMASMSVTMPVVTAAQNGSGVAAVTETFFDTLGRPIWMKDADGFIHFTEYDTLTGGAIRSITDIDITQLTTAELATLPLGWVTPLDGGLHLTTTMEVDTFGRETKMTDPNGNLSFTVYNDAAHEVRSYSGWHFDTSLGAYTTTGPIMISRTDRPGSYSEYLTLSAQPDTLNDRPTGTEAITTADIESLSRSYTNAAGQMTHSDAYFDLTGVTYSTSGPLGIEGTHFLRSSYDYDDRGRVKRTEDSTGTITRPIYDLLGRTVATWIGTDDTPDTGFWSPSNNVGANMVQVSATVYDNGGVGDGLVTSSSSIADVGVEYETVYQYDTRNRMIGSRGPDGVASLATLDNLGRTIVSETYADLNADFVIDTGELRGRSEMFYDNRSRVYSSSTYEVDQVTGVASDRLTSNVWYNQRGMAVKSADPNGLFAKTSYDGAGRAIESFLSYDADETDWVDALDVAGDTVIEQSRNFYDPGSRPVASVSYMRLENDVLGTGRLNGLNSYRRASVNWFDEGDRLTHSATFGTDPDNYVFDALGEVRDLDLNGIPDEAEGAPREPDSSDDWLASKTEYDEAGRGFKSTNNAGQVTITQFDLLNRTTAMIENYIDGVVSEAEFSSDRTTATVYDSAGRLSQQVAYNPQGVGNGVESQVTQYLYESPINGSWVTNTIYPDSTDTLSAGTDQVKTIYDRLGRAVTSTDQRGVEHTYSYDTAGRLESDAVTTLPAGVDGSVLRIERAYDDMGRLQTLTSHDAASLGNVVNQVQWSYNGYGLVAETFQEHDGAVDGSTPSVVYTYDDGAVGGEAKFVRLGSVTYPDGRQVFYNYPTSGVGAVLSRLDNIAEDAAGVTQYAHYEYLGAGTIVTVTHPDVTNGLTFSYGANGVYGGWDRFGRIVDQKWTSGDGLTVLDEYTYTYDRASNRTSRGNVLNSALSETYLYDDLNRLIDTNRGGVDYQDWGLDALGNWDSFTDQGVTETRDANAANEITDISSGMIPTYDEAGNMTSGPSPDDPNVRMHFTYDAWNRLVAVHDDNTGVPGSTIATYGYDGRNYRVEKSVGSDATDFFYNEDWQLLESLINGLVAEQYVWDIRYVDAAVLRDRDTGADGIVDERLFYTQDANYNVTALIDVTTGLVIERYSYEAYGDRTMHDALWGILIGGSAFANALGHQGLVRDIETGLIYNRARYLHTHVGRFLQRDPLGIIDGLNAYTYARLSPHNYTDPLGWKAFRVGTGPVPPPRETHPAFNSKTPTATDKRVASETLDFVTGSVKDVVAPNGIRALHRFLTGKGGREGIPMLQVFKDVGSIRDTIATEVIHAVWAATQHARENPSIHPVGFPLIGKWETSVVSKRDSVDWWAVFRGFAYISEATVNEVKWNTKGTCCFEMSFTFTMFDGFNFDAGDVFRLPGGIIEIQADVLRSLHETGLAQNYELSGSLYTTKPFKWCLTSSGALLNTDISRLMNEARDAGTWIASPGPTVP